MVVLAGDRAYKFKKPVNYGFLDFSTLDRRREFCEMEMRLNRRLAPDLYLETLPVTGTAAAPLLGGQGTAIEYCVCMRRFAAGCELAELIGQGAIGRREIDDLAAQVAAFHAAAPVVGAGVHHGSPASVVGPALHNFDHLLPHLAADAVRYGQAVTLRDWTVAEGERLAGVLAARKAGGFIRECHGDMHLGNMVLDRGRVTIFDCIEFSDELRCIDVMSEAAFVAMDLERHGRRDLAWRFLNRYLEATGDYDGLAVLRFHQVYRALVRAKVCLLRATEGGAGACEEGLAYFDLAVSMRLADRRLLAVVCGPSGSGKSTISMPLAERLGAVRLRSDVERKRLHGLGPLADSGSATGGGIYSESATAHTYARLAGFAGAILDAGLPAVIDATCGRREQRERFRAVAERNGACCAIVELAAPREELERRIAHRAAAAGDPSEATVAVLHRQLSAHEPATADELSRWVTVDVPDLGDPVAIAAGIEARLAALAPVSGITWRGDASVPAAAGDRSGSPDR